MKNQLFISIILTVLLSSCVQINSLQTAKTVPKGDTRLGVAIVGQGFVGGLNSLFPHFETFARRGIVQNFDVGIKLSTVASINIDGKYQFYGNQTSKFAWAVGAAFELQSYDLKEFIRRQSITLYFSSHPNESFAFYTSPKFIYNSDDNYIFIGGNIGLQKRVKPRFSIIVEGSSLYGLDDSLIYQAGVGFLFDLK